MERAVGKCCLSIMIAAAWATYNIQGGVEMINGVGVCALE